MTREVVVETENLSKKFCGRLKRSLRYGIVDLLKEATGTSRETEVLRPEEFWALRRIHLTLRRGECLGLIGSNGSGKTTLLKLINGLLRPTAGEVRIRGSVRSLITLGLGFNPVLTGRENIRISSAIYGYDRQAEERLFDEIVAFSELDKFLDSPIRTYSSGMLARLGFSVAVHTHPDIMLIDEVLAVGDLRFILKCYQKISEFRRNGGSIILVSHNMFTIRRNCDRVLWLDKGRIKEEGEPDSVAASYEQELSLNIGPDDNFREYVDPDFELVSLRYPSVLSCRDSFTIDIHIEAKRAVESTIIGITILSSSGIVLVNTLSDRENFTPRIQKGQNKIRISYENLPLANGLYGINFVVSDGNIQNHLILVMNKHEFVVKNDRPNYGTEIVVKPANWKQVE